MLFYLHLLAPPFSGCCLKQLFWGRQCTQFAGSSPALMYHKQFCPLRALVLVLSIWHMFY